MKTIHLICAANNRIVPHFPESSLSLAGVLTQAGYKVKITDAELTPRSKWKWEDPLFFGITVYSNSSIGLALSIAHDLRQKYPTVPLVWGGPHAQMVPEQTASHYLVDAACYDEGEIVITAIADQLTAGEWDPSQINGLCFRAEGGRIVSTPPQELIDVNSIPYHPYHLLDLSLYFLSQQKAYYQSSRGCPFSCTFCARTQQRRWRPKSPEIVLSHLGKMIRELAPNEVYFSDANFFVDIERAVTICEGMVSKGFNISWSAFCRCDTIMRMDEEFLRLLKRAGCRQLDIGGESGSDAMLKSFSKGITRDTILESVRKLCGVGIKPELSFIAGAPNETEDDFKQTLSLVDTIYSKYPLASINGIFHYQPYPNSSLGETTIKEWNLPIPSDLESWNTYPIAESRREYFPWLSNKQYRRMMLIGNIASYKFLYGRLIESPESDALNRSLKWRLLKTSLNIMHKLFVRWIIYFRWNLMCDILPIEWNLYSYLRNKIIKTI